MTWTAKLVEDETVREEAVREFTLRVIRRGADPINYWLLQTVHADGPLTIDDLAADIGLTKATLSERVNDLVQVGLLSRSLDGDGIQATVLTEGYLGVVEDLTGRVSEAITEEVPDAPESRV